MDQSLYGFLHYWHSCVPVSSGSGVKESVALTTEISYLRLWFKKHKHAVLVSMVKRRYNHPMELHGENIWHLYLFSKVDVFPLDSITHLELVLNTEIGIYCDVNSSMGFELPLSFCWERRTQLSGNVNFAGNYCFKFCEVSYNCNSISQKILVQRI